MSASVMDQCLEAAESYALTRLNAVVRTRGVGERGANLQLWPSLSTWDAQGRILNAWRISTEAALLDAVQCHRPAAEAATVSFTIEPRRAAATVIVYWMGSPGRVRQQGARVEFLREGGGYEWVAGDPPQKIKIGSNPLLGPIKEILSYGG